MAKQKYTPKQIQEAITLSSGFLTQAAKNLGCTYQTINNYLTRFPELKETIIFEREKVLDFAESQLILKIKEGDLTAIIFYLKTQGKQRGYSEKHIVESRNLHQLNISGLDDKSITMAEELYFRLFGN